MRYICTHFSAGLTEIYRDRSQGGLALTFIRKQAKKLPNYQLHYVC